MTDRWHVMWLSWRQAGEEQNGAIMAYFCETVCASGMSGINAVMQMKQHIRIVMIEPYQSLQI